MVARLRNEPPTDGQGTKVPINYMNSILKRQTFDIQRAQKTTAHTCKRIGYNEDMLNA
jgi:hypothetical protein